MNEQPRARVGVRSSVLSRGLRRLGGPRLVALAVGVVLVVTHPWQGAVTVVRGNAEVFTFGCCSASDLTRPLHPGEAFVMHWVVKPVSLPGTSDPVTLDVRVFGPFPDVVSLKSAFSDGPTPNVPVAQYAAPLISTRSTDGSAHTSTIQLPPGAAAGFYDVESMVTSAGAGVGGGSIISVTARG